MKTTLMSPKVDQSYLLNKEEDTIEESFEALRSLRRRRLRPPASPLLLAVSTYASAAAPPSPFWINVFTEVTFLKGASRFF